MQILSRLIQPDRIHKDYFQIGRMRRKLQLMLQHHKMIVSLQVLHLEHSRVRLV